jgi:Ssp1 endopeptidase immunity protein Rap1a
MRRTLTLALLPFAMLLASREARAVDSPRQLASYCEMLERSTKGSGRQVRIPNTKEALLCWGYIQAMQDLFGLADESGARIMGACPPEDGTLLDLVRSFVAYARSHPAELQGNTALVVAKAMQAAYPCPATDPAPAR